MSLSRRRFLQVSAGTVAATAVMGGAAVAAAAQSGAIGIDGGLIPIEVVSSLPQTGSFAGRLVYLVTDGRIYRYVGDAFDPVSLGRAFGGAPQ